MKGQVDAVDYKVILLLSGDVNNTLDLTDYISSQSTKQGVKLENDSFDLSFNLVYNYKDIDGVQVKAHQFCDVQNHGKLIISKKDIVRVFIKRVDNTDIDINSRTDLLAEYFIKDWNLNPMSFNLTLTMSDINYKIYNRLFFGTYGYKDSGTYTGISTDVLTDTTKSWTINQHINKTLELIDSNGRTYNYVISSNTSNSVTCTPNIDSGLLTTYKIGENSANVIHDSMLQVTPSIDFNGEYKLASNYTTKYGSDYVSGIQLKRPDGYAFPIIDYSQSRKAYYKMIGEVGSIDAVNTVYEIENSIELFNRDMTFSTEFNTELDKYVINWYYTIAVEQMISGIVTDVGTNTITDSSLSMTTNEYKNKLMRVNNKSYTILSNTSTVFTLSSTQIQDFISISDTYIIYDNCDYIWDSEQDYRHIYTYTASNKTDGKVNHIFFSCGKNEMSGVEIIGHLFNRSTDASELTETYIPMTYIAKEVLVDDNRLINGVYTYPSYPYTIVNKAGEHYALSEEVNSDASYNVNLKDICRNKAYRICENRFNNIKEGSLKINFTIRGNKYLQAGNLSDKSKVYNTGSIIMFKDVGNGIYNEDESNGYYYLSIDTIKHNISTSIWTTTLTCSVDIYSDVELS